MRIAALSLSTIAALSPGPKPSRTAMDPLPDAAGRPTDVVRFRDGLVVLAERALVRLDTEAKGAEIVARVEGKASPFEITDAFCAAPLAVLDGELYAGGQRGGALFRLVASIARGL